MWSGKVKNQVLTVATLVTRNANEAMIALKVGSGGVWSLRLAEVN